MGARGTDVAPEAAAVVLLEDDFAALVHGIRTGRRIVDNLKKALAYILAVHLPIVGLTLVPIAMGWPLVLMPIHIAFLHLVIDHRDARGLTAEADGVASLQNSRGTRSAQRASIRRAGQDLAEIEPRCSQPPHESWWSTIAKKHCSSLRC
jgi:magnesium-transporting ATPase (P-type)